MSALTTRRNECAYILHNIIVCKFMYLIEIAIVLCLHLAEYLTMRCLQ